jgi:hypothetical protein
MSAFGAFSDLTSEQTLGSLELGDADPGIQAKHDARGSAIDHPDIGIGDHIGLNRPVASTAICLEPLVEGLRSRLGTTLDKG